jgi:hypothetical protein
VRANLCLACGFAWTPRLAASKLSVRTIRHNRIAALLGEGVQDRDGGGAAVRGTAVNEGGASPGRDQGDHTEDWLSVGGRKFTFTSTSADATMAVMTGEQGKIVRTWSATATGEGADAYQRYFADTLLPWLRDRPGFAGGYLLSRSRDGVVELTTHTIWASLEAIHAFAGDDIAASVVEPEARAVLVDYDRVVTHRNVLVAVSPGVTPPR